MHMIKKIVRRAVPHHIELPGSVHPVLQRIFAARGLTGADQLDLSLSRLLPFQMLQGVAEAAALLSGALERQQRIVIVADFDADGATSCAVAIRGLRALGAKHVHYVVPNRFEYGYGLTPEIVAVANRQRPDLLITVDNGIASIEGVVAAKRLGMRVLITDHHLPGASLPEADAIVNPNQPDDEFPSKHLCGVGVMFYVLIALRAFLRAQGWFEHRAAPNLAELLDLVALGTIADVVKLDQNNRILVAQGLARIRGGRCHAGMRALIAAAGRDQRAITSSDRSFAVAPRLNAAGRLTDMSLGIECLLSDDPAYCATAASELDQLNRERKEIERGMQEQALKFLSRFERERSAPLPNGICLYQKDWHQGVVGIVAARIKERLLRPVVAFADDPAAGGLKGSARSVEGVHIRDALDRVAVRNPGLIEKFGGHAMAAGLSIKREKLAEFAMAFDRVVSDLVGNSPSEDVIYSDGELTGGDFDLQLAELTSTMPWGAGFPEPVFDGEFELVKSRLVAGKYLQLTLRPAPRAPLIRAIAFGAAEYDGPEGGNVRAAYRLGINDYNGLRSVQLLLMHVEPAD